MGEAWKTRIGPALAGIGGFMPLNLAKLEAEGVDLAERQEWVPAVQTLRGGVRVDSDGQSDLPGLFAAGMTEALDPGLFNGWSTMRAMGSGERSGRGAAAYLRQRRAGLTRRRPDRRAGGAGDRADGAKTAGTPRPDHLIERVHALIFDPEVSISKRGEKLAAALADRRSRAAALPDLAAPRRPRAPQAARGRAT